jgi:membrane-bound serine protease (ClpP class)
MKVALATLYFVLFLLKASAVSADASAGKTIHLLTYEGAITPVASELFASAISNAQKAGAQGLIIQLDTPGGLETAMRDIVKAMIASEVPVIVHVYPSGGRAASAGVFIMLAAHIAAMSPGTNMGAAHPVAIGTEKMDAETAKKVENDAAAYIRSIAAQRGRDPKWAEEAVRQSVSVTEKEALEMKLIDVIAKDLDALLQQLDGKTVHRTP